MKSQLRGNTFSDILQAERSNNSKLTSYIVDELIKRGVEITPRTVQLYKKGSVVPDYNLAKEILKILDISIHENELLSLLERSKAQKISGKDSGIRKTIDPEVNNVDNSILKRRISIKAESFSFLENSGLPSSYAIELIETRVRESYGDDKYAFNRYIRDLIDEDMKK